MHNKRFADTSVLPKIIAAIVGIVLIIVNIIRIIRIPITFDENGYPGNGKYDTYIGLAQDKFGSANNHILHSLFRKFFVDNFGNTLFTLRVDSLIAQVVFLIFSYLLCGRLFKNKWWALSCFLILNFASPLIFEFWGLSRGYALALSFMMISIYYLSKYIDRKEILSLVISFACAVLSVYSNFGYINYFLVLCAVVLIRNLLFMRSLAGKAIAKEFIVILIASGVLAIMITGPLKAVYHNGELQYMGSSGFIKNTVRTVVYAGFGLIPNPERLLVYVISRVVIILTFLSGLFWTYVYWQKFRRKEFIDADPQYGIIFFLFLIFPAISLIAQHKLFGINYLTDRTALFFIILFTLQIVYLLYYLRNTLPVISTASFAFLFLLAAYNFCYKVNVSTTILWDFNSADLAVLRRMDTESKNKPGKIKVGISWLSETTFPYDILHHYSDRFYPLQMITNTLKNDSSCDYFYLNIEDFPKLPCGYSLDTECIGDNFVLFKKNK